MSFASVPTIPTPCASDPDLMFDALRIEEAKAQCAGCHFLAECLVLSADEEFGVWAGEVKLGTLAEARPHRDARYAELDERLSDRLTAGGTYKGLAREYGVSEAAVRRMARRQGVEHLRVAS